MSKFEINSPTEHSATNTDFIPLNQILFIRQRNEMLPKYMDNNTK